MFLESELRYLATQDGVSIYLVNPESDVTTDQPAARVEEAAEDEDAEGGEDGGETDHQDDMPCRDSLHHPPLVSTSGIVQ